VPIPRANALRFLVPIPRADAPRPVCHSL